MAIPNSDGQFEIEIKLTPSEIEMISSLMQAQTISLDVLDREAKRNPTIIEQEQILSSLERKLEIA